MAFTTSLLSATLSSNDVSAPLTEKKSLDTTSPKPMMSSVSIASPLQPHTEAALENKMPDAIPHTTTDLIKGAQWIGYGSYGDVFKIDNKGVNDRACKLYNISHDHVVRENKLFWNDIYPIICNGKHKNFANAEYRQLINNDDGFSPVLDMPYIKGRPAKSSCLARFGFILFGVPCWLTSDLKAFQQEMNRHNFSMPDCSMPGNVRIYDGDLLPIDMDRVVRLPDQVTATTFAYKKLPDARSLAYARKLYFFKDYVSYQEPGAPKKKNQSNDKIGFRSYFIRP